MSSEVHVKIRKLLALAASSGSKDESELAMTRAQELMDKHRITEIEQEVCNADIIRDPFPLLAGKRMLKWKQVLTTYLCYFNNCKLIKFRVSDGVELVAFGRPNDLDHVRYLLAYLTVEITQYGSVACICESAEYRDSWYSGAVDGVYARLNEGRKMALKNAPQFALVKFGDGLREVEKFISENVGKVKLTKLVDKSKNHTAYADGHETGYRINTNQRYIKASPTLS